MDILGQSSLIVALVAFALAVTALTRNLRNKVVMAYALSCALASLWALSFFLEKIFGTDFCLQRLDKKMIEPIPDIFIKHIAHNMALKLVKSNAAL